MVFPEGLTDVSHGCWLEASVPYHVRLSLEQLASPRASDPRENQEGTSVPQMTWPQKPHAVTSAMFYSLEMNH